MLVYVLFFFVASAFSNNEEAPTRIYINNKTDSQYVYEFINKFESIFDDISILEEEAKNQELSISDMEISARTDEYRMLFPEDMIDQERIRNILIIEKYLIKVKKIVYENYKLQQYYDEFIQPMPKNLRPSLSQIKSIIQSIILFTDKKTIESAKMIQEEEAREIFKPNEKPTQKRWSPEELYLRDDPNECVAFMNGSNTCIVTIRDFNTAVSTVGSIVNIYRFNPKDRARLMIVKGILSNLYYLRLGDTLGLSNNTELTTNFSRIVEGKKYSAALLRFGGIVTDEANLLRTYDRYYNDLFKSKKEHTIDLIGASDSLYIDSLYTIIQMSTNDDLFQKEIHKKTKKAIDDLPWQRSMRNHLSSEIAKATDSLRINEYTKPFKTKYGFFIARLSGMKITQEKTYEKARQQLIYLASRDKNTNKDSVINEKVFQEYQKNLKKYVTPDTMNIKAYLFPFFSESKKDSVSNVNQKIIHFLKQKRKMGMSLSSLMLPLEVQEELSKVYHKGMLKQNIYGPLYTQYGCFYFEIQGYKIGGRRIPFEGVRVSITAAITKDVDTNLNAWWNTEDTLFSEEDIDIYFQNRIKADFYKLKLIENVNVARMITDGIFDTIALENKSEKALQHHAQKQYIHKISQDINQWIEKNIEINDSLMRK